MESLIYFNTGQSFILKVSPGGGASVNSDYHYAFNVTSYNLGTSSHS